jgi:hypothetical protein
VDDLKELYNKRNHIEPKRNGNAVCDKATRSSKRFRAENPTCSQISELHQTPTPDVPMNIPTKNKETLLHILLDTVEDVDEDVAIELLAELVEAAEPSSENREPQPTDLHTASLQGLRNPTEKLLCLSSCISGNGYVFGNPISMAGEIINKSSGSLGTAQKPHDDGTSSNALNTWHHGDMEREIIPGGACVDISSALDVH